MRKRKERRDNQCERTDRQRGKNRENKRQKGHAGRETVDRQTDKKQKENARQIHRETGTQSWKKRVSKRNTERYKTERQRQK